MSTAMQNCDQSSPPQHLGTASSFAGMDSSLSVCVARTESCLHRGQFCVLLCPLCSRAVRAAGVLRTREARSCRVCGAMYGFRGTGKRRVPEARVLSWDFAGCHVACADDSRPVSRTPPPKAFLNAPPAFAFPHRSRGKGSGVAPGRRPAGRRPRAPRQKTRCPYTKCLCFRALDRATSTYVMPW